MAGGLPINLSSGNTFFTQTDVNVPGLGGGLTLSRTWNSLVPPGVAPVGLFGNHWVSSYEERIFVDSDQLVKSSSGYGDVSAFGVITLFAPGPTTTYGLIAPKNGGASLVSDGTQLTLTAKSGEKKIFSVATGLLLSISDRNGNTTQLTYDSSSRLTSVADAAGRHLYFSYTQNLVTGVSSDFGISLSYTYDGMELSRVTRPDNTYVTFERTYLAGSLQSLTMKDQDGKVLESHTFASIGRGRSSQRANGFDAMSVDYLQ